MINLYGEEESALPDQRQHKYRPPSSWVAILGKRSALRGGYSGEQTETGSTTRTKLGVAAHIGSFLGTHASRRTPVAYEKSNAANTVSCKAQSIRII